jgi:hypothetical protein
MMQLFDFMWRLASAVNSNICSPGFGQIVNAAPPRQVQMAAKLQF